MRVIQQRTCRYDFWGVPSWTFSSSLVGRLLSLEPSAAVIKKIPFQAKTVSRNSRLLPDGGRIVSENQGLVARDMFGRLRREETYWTPFSTNPTTTVFISDPVSGFCYRLDTRYCIAFKFIPFSSYYAYLPLEKPPAITSAINLGTCNIHGLSAEGKRAVAVFHGSGKSATLRASIEEWYSLQLATVVVFKRDDPLTGTTVLELGEVSETEPVPSLFEVPRAYRRVD